MGLLDLIVPLAGLMPLFATAAPATSPTTVLEKRGAQTCKIVNVDSYVNCRYSPSLDSGSIFDFPAGDKLTFACYKKGDCFNGYCTWDQVTYIGTTCYVNRYFTDDNCSSSILPEC